MNKIKIEEFEKTGFNEISEQISQKIDNNTKKKQVFLSIPISDMDNPEEFKNSVIFLARSRGMSMKSFILGLINDELEKDKIFKV